MNTFDELRMMILTEGHNTSYPREFDAKEISKLQQKYSSLVPNEKNIDNVIAQCAYDISKLRDFLMKVDSVSKDFPDKKEEISAFVQRAQNAIKFITGKKNDFENKKKLYEKLRTTEKNKKALAKPEDIKESVKELKLKVYESWDAGLIKDYEKDYLLEYINESCMDDE